MAEAGPEIPRVEELVGEGEHEHNKYGRLIAIAIVVTTLIGAMVAFAQAGALRTHDQADARAETYGTLALESSAVNRGQADVEVDRLNLATQEVRAANNASLFQTYGNASTATRLTAARWNAIAAQTEADTAAIAGSEGIARICSPSIEPHCPAAGAAFSPEQDPRFPTRYVQQGQREAYRLTALRDASNQAADDAEAQFVHYAAALTMLAVAVFLLGYSLTPQGQARRLLYSRVAGGLVLVAGGWALFQVLSPVTTPPAAAASAFADGEVALNDGDYHAAISAFNRVLAKSPRFVDAYYDRGQAEYGAGFPRTGSGTAALPTTAGPATIPTTTALDAAIRDDERAHDEGSDSATLLLDMGRDLLYRGLLTHSQEDLRTSHDDLAAGLAQLKQQDDVTTLVAAADLRMAEDDLALGHGTAAQEYRAAETALQAPDVPKEATVAAALTDLSLIETSYPKLAARTDAERPQIVTAGERGSLTPTGNPASGQHHVQLGGISAQPDPGHALYTVDKPGAFDPQHDVLSAQWEYKDPLHGEWAVLPEISGPVGRGGLSANGSGFASNNVSYVSSSSPATCLPRGQYKVELYINGQLSGTATANGSWPPLQAVRFSDVDGAMCVPAGWQSFNAGAGADGNLAPDGTGGAAIFSIPKAAFADLANDQGGLATVMQGALQGLSGSNGLLPDLKSAGAPQPTPFFMSSDNGQYQAWTDKNGDVLSGIGTAANGQIYIGVAWGPSADLAQQLFLSLSPL
jgi:tetratricopeptide (TPR) repeat protein